MSNTYIQIETEDFSLQIINDSFDSRIQTYCKLMDIRKESITKEEINEIFSKYNIEVKNSSINLNPNKTYIHGDKPTLPVCANDCKIKNSESVYHFGFPYFFDNSSISFEFNVYNGYVPKMVHKLERINKNFHLMTSHKSCYFGKIDTSNNIGYIRLPLQLTKDNKTKEVEISFYVFSVKLLSEVDMSNMLRPIDAAYPFWRYSISNPTSIGLDKNDHNKKQFFPILWLSRFLNLYNQLDCGLKRILANPHLILIDFSKQEKTDKIHGKISSSLENIIAYDKKQNALKRSYRVISKKSTLDTKENQFILYIVKFTRRRLEKIHNELKVISRKETKSFSSAFLDKFNYWSNTLRAFEKHPMCKGISDFTEVNTNSMVLQQKSGYSSVFRVWQELKYYLSILGKDCEVALKTVSELYEIWCFLEMKNILNSVTSKYGFIEAISKDKAVLKKKDLEYSLDDKSSSFKFVNEKKSIEVELIHEYKAGKNSQKSDLISWTTVQKPDIILKVNFKKEVEREIYLTNFPSKLDEKKELQYKSSVSVIWLFDAKYRIAYKNESEKYTSKEDDFSWVPDDAINIMHRYRDSLIQKLSDFTSCRAVVGAYALYPGIYNQTDPSICNPYSSEIEKVNIGGFPLLPSNQDSSDRNQNNAWLYDFIDNIFGLFCCKTGESEIDKGLSGIKTLTSQLIFPTTMGLYTYKHLMLGINLSKCIAVSDIDTTKDTPKIILNIDFNKNTQVDIVKKQAFITMLMSSLEYIYLYNKDEENSTKDNYQLYQTLNCVLSDSNSEHLTTSLIITLGLKLTIDNNNIRDSLEHLHLSTLNNFGNTKHDSSYYLYEDLISSTVKDVSYSL